MLLYLHNSSRVDEIICFRNQFFLQITCSPLSTIQITFILKYLYPITKGNVAEGISPTFIYNREIVKTFVENRQHFAIAETYPAFFFNRCSIPDVLRPFSFHKPWEMKIA